jgi:hypothetical protein
MLLTLTLILVATVGLAAVELWLFWQIGRRAAGSQEDRIEIKPSPRRRPKSRLVNRAA